jgi:hypothetical protein
VSWLDDARKAHHLQLKPTEVPVLFADAHLNTIATPIVRRTAMNYLTGFWELADDGKAPAFLGRAGTYKSLAAAVIARFVRDTALLDTAFVQCGPEFLELERRRFEVSTHQRIVWLTLCPFVVFDDFTKLKPGSFGLDSLDAIVEKRYGYGFPTLYTGNVVVQKDDWSEVTNHFGAGFARRLQEGAAGLTAVVK